MIFIKFKNIFILVFVVPLDWLSISSAQDEDIIDACEDAYKYPHWGFSSRIYCSEVEADDISAIIDEFDLYYPGIDGLFYIYQNIFPYNRITAFYPDERYVQITLSYYSTVDLEIHNVRTGDGRPGIVASVGYGWTTRVLKVVVPRQNIMLDLDLSRADFEMDFFILDKITVQFEYSTEAPVISTTIVPTTNSVPGDFIDECEDRMKYPYWIFADRFPCQEGLPASELPLDGRDLDYPGLKGVFYVHNKTNLAIAAIYPTEEYVLVTINYYSTLDLEVSHVKTDDGRPGIIASGPTGWTTRSLRMSGPGAIFHLDLSSCGHAAPEDFFLLDKISITFEPELPTTTEAPRIDEFIDTCEDRTKYPHWDFHADVQCSGLLPENELPLDGLNLYYPNLTGFFFVNNNVNTEFYGVYPEQEAVTITLSYFSTQDLSVTNVITSDGRPGIVKSEGTSWTTRTLEVNQRGRLVFFLIELAQFDYERDFFLLDKIAVTFGAQ